MSRYVANLMPEMRKLDRGQPFEIVWVGNRSVQRWTHKHATS